MDEFALNPVVQEALNFSRKAGRFFQIDGTLVTLNEYRNLWEGMTADRSLTASLMACLITKSLILNYYELRLELSDSLLNVLTSKPLVSEAEKARTTSSVKNDMKKHMDLKVAVFNSIVYVTLHYPLDMQHFAIKKAYTTWLDDIEKNRGNRDNNFESDLCQLFFSNEKVDSEIFVKEWVIRCASLNKQDLIEFYNSPHTLPQNKALADPFALSFLLYCIQRRVYQQAIMSTTIQLLGSWATMSDLKFQALVKMVKEFLLRDPTIDSKTLTTLSETINPFYGWPTPFCDDAAQLLQYIDFKKRTPNVVSCLHFLEDHPDILAKRPDDYVHVIINSESVYGPMLKEILGNQPTKSLHELRSQFLLFFYKTFFEDENEVYQIAALDQNLVSQICQKAVDIVMKVASVNGNMSSKGSITPKLKDIKQSIEDQVRLMPSPPPKVPYSAVPDLETGYVPFTVWDLQEGEISLNDKGIYVGIDEIPDVGGFHTLEKIFNQPPATKGSNVNVRIVICGGDATISNLLIGYTILRNNKPDLFKSINPTFYVLPAGNHNSVAACLSLFDTWYGRQVFFGMKSITLVPPTAGKMPFQEKKPKMTEGVQSTRDLFDRKESPNPIGVAPHQFIKLLLDQYLRHGRYLMPMRVYLAEIHVVTQSGTVRRVIPFSQSVEVGFGAFNKVSQKAENLSKLGKRASTNFTKAPKFAPPEVSVKFTEIDVVGVTHPAPAIASKVYWSIQISNLPRTSEYEVVKPFANCLELHLLDLENGRKARGKATALEDDPVYYVNSVELEDSTKKLFDFVIDTETIQGVYKVKITPANDSLVTGGDDVTAQPLIFPIATFTPVAN